MTAKAATLQADVIARKKSARALLLLAGLVLAMTSAVLLNGTLLLRFP